MWRSGLEWCGGGEAEGLLGDGVHELQVAGMQAKALRVLTEALGLQTEALGRHIEALIRRELGAVKLVANDWGVESLAVCGVHAQLVCATCERSELNARDAVAPVDNAKERGGWFAVLGVNYLARTVGNVGR